MGRRSFLALLFGWLSFSRKPQFRAVLVSATKPLNPSFGYAVQYRRQS